MERQEAIHRLTDIVNQDLRPLAEQYKVPVFFKENGSKNNIWPSQVLKTSGIIPQFVPITQLLERQSRFTTTY